jgi:hypothetical protein
MPYMDRDRAQSHLDVFAVASLSSRNIFREWGTRNGEKETQSIMNLGFYL